MIIKNCELREKIEHILCHKKALTPLKYTHTTTSLQISHQKTQSFVQPTAAAFDKVQVQRIHGQFDHDKFYNKTLENINMYFPPNISNFNKIIAKET